MERPRTRKEYGRGKSPKELEGYGRRNRFASQSPLVSLRDASVKRGANPNELLSVFSSRVDTGNFLPHGMKGVSILLNYDFSKKEIVLKGGLSIYSMISEYDAKVLWEYMLLREKIRNGELAPASSALGTRSATQMKRLNEFIIKHVVLPPEVEVPCAVISRKLEGLRFTVRKFDTGIYCNPHHAPGLVFASRILEGTDYLRSRYIKSLERELRESEHIYPSLGLKLWISNAICMENREMMGVFLKVIRDARVQVFFSESRGGYLERSPLSPPKRSRWF